MDLPIDIKNKLESLLDGYKLKDIKEVSFQIIDKYKNESGKGKNLIDSELLSKVYAVTRFPATFKVSSDIIEDNLSQFKDEIHSLIDFGSGSGASSLAAYYSLTLDKITQFEREESMIKVGQYLFNDEPISKISKYQQIDLAKKDINETADLVVSSYFLNELEEKDRHSLIEKMWKSTSKYLLIIEPGTPKGYEIIKEVRAALINKGGYIIAPCPHMAECPISFTDWCHFSTRISRSRLHKELKDADVPYEDEKYSYIIFSKNEVKQCDYRILRHPQIHSGFVELEVCSKEGIKNIKFSKKDKELFKKARKAKAGDSL